MNALRIKVEQGIVKGCLEKLPNDKNYIRFSGIPYAEKPINELKFKSPKKLIKFDKPEIDCTKEGNECFQKSTYTGKFIGSEDCLYLNVYVPEAKGSSKKSVMVFIHGGGYSSGSSSAQLYSPEYLIMEDVIVVTINYRIHALGFLSLPSMGISGNAGLKDQQMALEWVYENISNFNGDPENICLFGESAGASSVHLHVLNKKSRKFIKSAICQSGCALADWGIQRNPVDRTKTLAELLECSDITSDTEIYDTLMKAPLEQLLLCSFKAQDPDYKRRNLSFVFTPSIELPSRDAFLTKSPVTLLQEEDIQIPIIFGTNDKDGIIMAFYQLSNIDTFNSDPVRMVPISLTIDPDSSIALEVAKSIKTFYFKDKDVGKNTIDNHIDLMTDIHFLTPQTISNELIARYQHKHKQYLYEFRFDGELNLFKQMVGMGKYKGASHVDELFYLFGQKMTEIILDENAPASKMRSTMCKLWTNFAKYQNPTPKNNNPLNFIWQPVECVNHDAQSVGLNYLVIDRESRMQSNVNGGRMDFWRNIYKTWNSKFIKPKL